MIALGLLLLLTCALLSLEAGDRGRRREAVC